MCKKWRKKNRAIYDVGYVNIISQLLLQMPNMREPQGAHYVFYLQIHFVVCIYVRYFEISLLMFDCALHK